MDLAIAQPDHAALSDAEESLLTAYLDNEAYPQHFARERGLSPVKFLLWLDLPRVKRLLATFEEALAFRQRKNNAHTRETALFHLHKAIERAPDPVETRRIATQMLRAIRPTRAATTRAAA